MNNTQDEDGYYQPVRMPWRKPLTEHESILSQIRIKVNTLLYWADVREYYYQFFPKSYMCKESTEMCLNLRDSIAWLEMKLKTA